MEGVRGRPRRGTVIEKFGGYKTNVKGRREERERLALRNKVKEEKHLEIYGGLSARPNGLREKAETAISCTGPRPTRQEKEIYQ